MDLKSPIFSPESVFPDIFPRIGPVAPSLAPLIPALLHCRAPEKKLLLITPDPASAERLTAETHLWLKALGRTPEILWFPEGSEKPGQQIAASDSPRSLALARTLSGLPELTIASAGAVFSPAPPPEQVRTSRIVLKRGGTHPLLELAEKLIKLDYDDELEVTVKGEFARRGGLMDIFSFSAAFPARVEFFGDEIDTIRLFDPATQRSIRPVDEYTIIMRSGAAASLDSHCTFLDYLNPEEILPVFLFPAEALRHLEHYAKPETATRFQEARDRFAANRVDLLDAAGCAETADAGKFFSPQCFPVDALIRSALPDGVSENFAELLRQWNTSLISRWTDEGTFVQIAGRSESDRTHIREWLNNAGLKEDGKRLRVLPLDLPCGVFLPGLKKAFLTIHDLFGISGSVPERLSGDFSSGQRHEADETHPGGEDLSVFADLEEGDRAVHIRHGICIYRGLKNVRTGGVVSEMIALEFDGGVLIHIPLWQAHYVSKYIGSGKAAVHLSKLASAKWGKTKAMAARSVQTLAYGMLRMQAIRSRTCVEPCPPDDFNQRLFEEAFPFRATADQERSASEIKHDMESGKPMDRLLCGDVGFGKTELAMRAAFKAVSAGRQVAVLAPTTVLAQQHYYSFLERFSGTPVLIEQLSRFRTKKEQTEILHRLAEGTLDIVIGTHRLVQHDVRFRNLGLIVIDEEQRFGVEDKERLKHLRVTADVLTMTATPIPRTLYLSMAGLRDLSTILSAPVQRRPVRTLVAQSEPILIQNAVARELERGGQVYFLHNRVATIDEEAKKLAALFPSARIGIAHGRMKEDELEEVMSRFIEGKLDILVCTTIIESGLDIPNANTIIIDRADRFGLAELYQLRGRVGRWTRQAYAYLLLPHSGILTGDARKRIAAIRSYTHLGAGFKLAVRDLEIRGSGNILGAEQSGQIHAIGFHLYCRLLRDCVATLRGEKPDTPPETDFFADFLVFASEAPPGRIAACFSGEFINSPRLRIDAYRRLAAISTEKGLDNFESELRDRFGKLPPDAENLLDCARIRIAGAVIGIHSIACRDNHVYLERDGAYLKPDGIVPRLKNSDSPRAKLKSLLPLLKKLNPGKPQGGKTPI